MSHATEPPFFSRATFLSGGGPQNLLKFCQSSSNRTDFAGTVAQIFTSTFLVEQGKAELVATKHGLDVGAPTLMSHQY